MKMTTKMAVMTQRHESLYELRTTRDFAEGQEISRCYGFEMSSISSLASYGIVKSLDSTHDMDCVQIPYFPTESDPLRLSMLHRSTLGHFVDTGPHETPQPGFLWSRHEDIKLVQLRLKAIRDFSLFEAPVHIYPTFPGLNAQPLQARRFGLLLPQWMPHWSYHVAIARAGKRELQAELDEFESLDPDSDDSHDGTVIFKDEDEHDRFRKLREHTTKLALEWLVLQSEHGYTLHNATHSAKIACLHDAHWKRSNSLKSLRANSHLRAMRLQTQGSVQRGGYERGS